MGKHFVLIAIVLNWLAALWLVGSAVSVTLGDGSRSIVDLKTGLAILLIPAAVAFGISCLLDRLAERHQDDSRRQVAKQPQTS